MIHAILFTLAGIVSTLVLGFLVRFACTFFDVENERTVVWCVTLGFVLGRGAKFRLEAGDPFIAEKAAALGFTIGPLLGLWLLWWWLYRRNRHEG